MSEPHPEDAGASTPTRPLPPVRPNPFVTALCSLGGLALAVAIVILFVDVRDLSSGGSAGALSVSGAFSIVGGCLLVAGLIVAGVDWSLRHRR